MRTLRQIRTLPLSSMALRTVGLVFLAAGMIGKQMQAALVSLAESQGAALFDLLEGSSSLMNRASSAMVLSVMEYLALPIFAFLLVEGAIHTKSYGKYLLRVGALAVVTQFPYMLLNQGPNPVFALFMSMIMLFFFRQFTGKGAGKVLIRIFAVLGCVLWSQMLSIPHGAPCVILCAALWLMKDRSYFRTFVGFAVTIACSIFSPAYAAGSLSFLIIHFYNGEQGFHNPWVLYPIYPVILALTAALGVMVG